jgi:hypothetical protein
LIPLLPYTEQTYTHSTALERIALTVQDIWIGIIPIEVRFQQMSYTILKEVTHSKIIGVNV